MGNLCGWFHREREWAVLVRSTCARFLQAIGDVLPFELAVGVNGRVWLNAEKAAGVIFVQKAVLESREFSVDEHPNMVQSLAKDLDLQESR